MPPLKKVISASRRTDIPAFYMKWFMERVKKGFFEVSNPYNKKVSRVEASTDFVHTIVFWSKNFRPFLSGGFGRTLQAMGYNLFFNFTINSRNVLLEPKVPPLADRMDQLKELAGEFGSDSIQWRFDPICFYKQSPSELSNNLGDFEIIANMTAESKIKKCITSFMDHYKKLDKRTMSMPGFQFKEPSMAKKKSLILWMEKKLTSLGIELFTCCEKEVMESLPDKSSVSPSSCIPNDYLMKIFGGRLSLRKDRGQRSILGCKCMVSSDIGSYQDHPCYHNCLFCYANPAIQTKIDK